MRRIRAVLLAPLLALPLPLVACAGGSPPPLPPAAGAHVAGCPASPNCVSTAAPPEDAQHHAEVLRFTGDVDAAQARMRAIVDAMPRTRLVEETPTTLRYTFTSALLRFVDDVDFVFVPDSGTIEYRSASRVGHGDMGVNRARVEAIARAWAAGDATR